MLFKGDNICLLRDLPEIPLSKDALGTVIRVLPSEQGQIPCAEIRVRTNDGAKTAIVPQDACEFRIAPTLSCTGVFWGLEKPPQKFIEDAMHAMLQHEFEMRSGMNAARVEYDRKERFWRWKEPFHDPTGAKIMESGPSWDGAAAAVSGFHPFQLEFRVAGRGQPVVLLHQGFDAYQEQRTSTHHAMSLLRVLLNLYVAVEAKYCAAPVASNWFLDESWDSLLREPYFPDLFLIPRANLPQELPPVFRVGNLINGRAILTTLPVKFSPADPPIRPTERDLKLNQLRVCKAIGEKAYDQLYETSSVGSPSGLYSDAKEAFHDAIRVADELGLQEESAELSKRLEHIKAVFRSQFS